VRGRHPIRRTPVAVSSCSSPDPSPATSRHSDPAALRSICHRRGPIDRIPPPVDRFKGAGGPSLGSGCWSPDLAARRLIHRRQGARRLIREPVARMRHRPAAAPRPSRVRDSESIFDWNSEWLLSESQRTPSMSEHPRTLYINRGEATTNQKRPPLKRREVTTALSQAAVHGYVCSAGVPP
jgi:hypothetical protein